jgi:hypothetical protein
VFGEDIGDGRKEDGEWMVDKSEQGWSQIRAVSDMAFRGHIPHLRRSYATVHSPLILAKPPVSPQHTLAPRLLDRFILETLANTSSAGRTALPQLIQQYLDRSANVLDAQLPYEPHPSSSRRVSFDKGGDVHLIAHVVRESDRSKITVSSGFTLETSDGQPILVTCAHTLEEVRRPPSVLCMDLNCRCL